jgi:formylglycine-generating enzyme required for sulfatase activity/tRNA A-37 threonylcarbamoyl transferase component Bud32
MPQGDLRPTGDATAEMTLPSAEQAPEALRPGDLLGQYRLLEPIGAGGMGQVFKAIHPTMQRIVAVKIMAASLVQDERARARFRREVQSAARLHHPNIVMAYDAAEGAGRCFLVMEYVEGRDAGALLQDFGPPPIAVACEVIRQAALGLQHAHEQGMVHRDVKPANLVIAARRTRDSDHGAPRPAAPGWPDRPLVKVLDFGLARFQAGGSDIEAHVPGSTPLTREGHVVGTPEFMAPEQACNTGRTDIRSDIYSLGCTFYCLLAGRPPFAGPSLLEIMVQHLQSPLPPLTRPDVPAGVVAVLERMLAKGPQARYQQPGEVAEALLPWIAADGPAEAVARSGRPVHLYPEAGPVHHATASVPGPTGVIAHGPLPRPGLIDRAVLAAARAVVGCLALFLVVIGSMAIAWVFLLRTDGGRGPEAPPDGPRAGPVAGMRLVRCGGGRLEPSFAERGALLDVPPFEMAMTEVTKEQFGTFVLTRGYRTTAETQDGHLGASLIGADGKETWSASAAWDTWRRDLSSDEPVVCVSWEDAVHFCNWLSERERLSACYQPQGGPGGWECNFRATGYRLPTEAEWEYAARAGERTLYPGVGDALLRHGWFRENSGGRPQPVGGLAHNRHDLCDLWGNVWEWCWDRQAKGPRKSPLPLAGPETGDERVLRGGGWADPAPTSPGQTREARPPDHRRSDLGFRVARTLPPR